MFITMFPSFALVLGALAATSLAIDNGLGISPPMGWRSWNCYHGDVSDSIMRATVDAMTEKSRTVGGEPTSLLDLGYQNCGLDDNWQKCGAGEGGSFHDAQGNPIVNTDTFPDMKAMTDYGHSKGIRMGWYHNNCICREIKFPDVNAHYHGDVKAIVDYGFDGVKLDGCGEFLNLTYWAQLLNETGRPVLIENCHWGGTVPTLDWCPWNFFRTSGDISSSWDSMFRNLQTTIKFQDWKAPLSRPGCWAYPDMLEVGNLASFNEDRAHFGAWCIVSAPLVLGLNLTDAERVDRVWPIVSNKEAIKVNQQWAGHPGTLISAFNPSDGSTLNVLGKKCNTQDINQTSWKFDGENIKFNNLCLDASHSSQLQVTTCNGADSQKFVKVGEKGGYEIRTPDANGKCLDVFDFTGPAVQLYGCNGGCNQIFNITENGEIQDTCSSPKATSCLDVSTYTPGDIIQVWAKPQPNKSMAVFVINNDSVGNDPIVVDIDFMSLNISGTVSIRDIWQQTNNGTASTKFTTDPIDAHDSRFFLFTPQ